MRRHHEVTRLDVLACNQLHEAGVETDLILTFGVVAVRFLFDDVYVKSGESFVTLIAKLVSNSGQVRLHRHK